MAPLLLKRHHLIFYFGLFLILQTSCQAQDNIPSGYALLYEEDFEEVEDLTGFEATDARAWKLSKGSSGNSLEIYGSSEYAPPFRSPFNIAIISGKKFGSFILEADLQQTGKEYGHRDLCLFFGMQNPSNFYYVHLASQADPHAHNVFLVNNAPRTAIGQTITEGVDWGNTDDWHKVRLERNVDTGTIKVYFDNMNTPVMITEDTHFGSGHIGFGTFDDSGKFDNIKIWGNPDQYQDSEENGFF